MHLWEWLLDLLDFINVMEHWRFALPALVACGVAALLYWLLPAGGLRTSLAATTVVAGLITGIFWERSR
ncbi:MAG: hypothetical protein HZA92_10145 [Verrucomicrobia bacterium]|nr:hypothetical protein [Verrucomicrobiota bacterium]